MSAVNQLGKYQPYPEYRDSKINWLGRIPNHWATVQSRRLFSLRKTKAYQNDKQLAATQKYGVIFQELFMELEGRRVVQVYKGDDILKHVEPGDFVISMRSFQGGIEYSPYSGSISSAYIPLTPIKWVYPDYFKYAFKSTPYIQALQSTSNLVRDGQALRFENFSLIDLPVVPLDEQRTIAAFLDYETARIDQLIAKQQQLIELLKEKRQAVISHAVTKGLNSNAPMKDSGVEWLGQVPEHWDVYRLRHVAKKMKAGPFGTALTKDMYTSSGYKVYGQEQVIPANFNIGDYYVSNEKYLELQQYTVKPGDVLISCVGTFGKIATFPEHAEPGIINPRLIKVTPIEKISSRFLEMVLRSHIVFEQMSLSSRGGTMDVVNIGILSELFLPMPPLSEQHSLIVEVQRLKTKFENLIDKAAASISFLQERRTALISAAVTGKIDLRGWQPPQREVAA